MYKKNNPKTRSEEDVLEIGKLKEELAELKEENIKYKDQAGELKFQRLFDSMSIGCSIWKRYGDLFKLYDYNKAGEIMDSLKKSDIVGKTVDELFPDPEKKFSIINLFDKVISTGEPEFIDESSYIIEGRTVWRENHIYKLSKNELVVIFKDITERKKVEDEIRKFKMITEQAVHGNAIADMEGNLLYINKAFAGIHGYEPDELLGKSLSLFHTEEQLINVSRINKGLAENGSYGPEEVWHVHRNGSEFPMLMSGILLFDGQGKPQFLAATAIDISELKRSEQEKLKLKEQLQQAQKMEAIGTLAGGIAHDFNNILGVIMGYTEITLDNLANTKKVIGNLQRVMKASERAKEMVKHILTFSRKDKQAMISLNIGKVIRETVSFLRSTIPTVIEIKYSIEEDLGQIFGNFTQINQVLMNLCTNATHAMRENGGVLEINLKEVILDKDSSALVDLQPGLYQQLTVSDTGTGMKKEILERIFEPYFTTKVIDEGTGMGLAVIYGIVSSHKGTINVYSEPGKGTVFNIYFPVLEIAEDRNLSEDQQPAEMGDNEKILLVDDELYLVELMSQILENLGYQVDSRTSSIEALELFRTNPDKYDLIITDMTMPNMTGVKLADNIHKKKPDMPVILCTGFSETVNKNNFESLGISTLIMKPVVKKDLAEAIKAVLDK